MAPWLTSVLLMCISKKKIWFQLFKQNIITYRCYNFYCKCLRTLLRQARSLFYKNKLSKLNKNPRENWKVINKLLNRNNKNDTNNRFEINGNTVTNMENISNEFCNFFTNKPILIDQSISDSQNNYMHLLSINPNSMSLFNTCNDEVKKALMSLRKNGDLYDLSSRFLKLSCSFLAPFLTELFNLCVQNGKYPSSFKLSKVIPIYKNKGSIGNLNNYRPISIISNLSKIFEKLLNNRLFSFFHCQNLLSKNQFGFRKNSNTELAILSLMKRIIPALKDKKIIICIFLDFTACFDTVCRNILLKKLEKYGVRGVSLEFIKSYFTNRKHYVSYGGFNSRIMDQNIGVIQGSKNGPFFYDVYSNDMNSICNGQNIMYADDTCLVFSGDNLDILTRQINERLKIIFDWCSFNRLLVNPSKSEFIIISRRKLDSIPNLVIGSDNIRHVKSVKYLGIVIDDNMKFISHAHNLKSRLSAIVGISLKIKHFLDIHSSKKFYYAFTYSLISYCIVVWGGILNNTQFGDKLFNLQKKIISNLFGKFSDGGCLFRKFRILKIFDIHKIFVAIYMFKALSESDTNRLLNFELNYPTHNYSTRQRNNAILPFPHVRSIKISFHYQFIEIWNSIPSEIKQLNNFRRFKSKLMNHFINMYN